MAVTYPHYSCYLNAKLLGLQPAGMQLDLKRFQSALLVSDILGSSITKKKLPASGRILIYGYVSCKP